MWKLTDPLTLNAGYNNSAIKYSLAQPGALASLVNRPALSMFPSLDYLDRMKNSLLSVAPPGLGKVITLMCGTCSNENAFKAAFIKYMVETKHTVLMLGRWQGDRIEWERGLEGQGHYDVMGCHPVSNCKLDLRYLVWTSISNLHGSENGHWDKRDLRVHVPDDNWLSSPLPHSAQLNCH